MHLVTSSVFLPSVAALVSPVARARLLHAYFMAVLSFYTLIRCPTLDFAGFYAHQPANASESQSQTNDKANPWLPLVQDAIEHHDEHLTKTQRALFAWASHFGSKTFASLAHSGAGKASAGIKGLELLDGNLFLKTAQLTTLCVGPPVVESGSSFLHGPATEWDFPDLSAA
jgi:Questin oxidase-like